MKMKTLEASSAEEIDKLAEAWNTQYNVRFTQTHFTYTPTTGKIYTYVFFYEDK